MKAALLFPLVLASCSIGMNTDLLDAMPRNNYASIDEAWEATAKTVYRAETGDAWATPRETEIAGAGDCEDIALLLAAHAVKQGHDAKIAIVYVGSGRSMHAMTIIDGVLCEPSLYGTTQLLSDYRVFTVMNFDAALRKALY